MNAVYNVGRVPLGAGSQNQIAITAVQSIILPTATQRVLFTGSLTPTARKHAVPVLEMWLTLEAQNARFTTDGSTPSATVGLLLIPGGLGPVVFLGESLIASLKFISPTAGGLISYSFYMLEAN